MPVEDILGKESPVHSQGTQHNTVHEHPSDKWRRGALVKTSHAFIADRLYDALQWPAEARGVSCLKAHFYCIEGMADRKLGDSREDAGYEPLVVLGLCRLLLLVGRHCECYIGGKVQEEGVVVTSTEYHLSEFDN